MSADVDPLIAIFTRAPEPGRVKQRLARVVGDGAALELQRALLTQTLQTVAASGIDAEIWVDGDATRLPEHPFAVRQQGAGDLGERMLGVVSDITARGRAAIVIGSDCPVLDAAYLRSAAAALVGGAPLVIGPVEDGGYVLIGMPRVVPRLFLGMTWSNAQVLTETLLRAADAGIDAVVLEELWDVDDAVGWQRWRRLVEKEAATTGLKPSRSSE
jgi:uncharacterized protein